MSCWSIAFRSGQASHGSVVGRVPAAAAAGGLLLLPPELQQRVAVVTGQERQRRQRRTREGRHQGQEDDAQGLPRRHHLHLRHRYAAATTPLASPTCSPSSSLRSFVPANFAGFHARPPLISSSSVSDLGVCHLACLKFWILFDFWGFCPILSSSLIRCKKFWLFIHRPLKF